MTNHLESVFVPRRLYKDHDPEHNEKLVTQLTTTLAKLREIQERKITGSVLISPETYQYLYEIHDLYIAKTTYMHWQDDDFRKKKERDAWTLLNEHRRNAQHYILHLTGVPGTKFPEHPQLGHLYAGDLVTMINRNILIHRRLGAKGQDNPNPLWTGHPGHYLVQLEERFVS